MTRFPRIVPIVVLAVLALLTAPSPSSGAGPAGEGLQTARYIVQLADPPLATWRAQHPIDGAARVDAARFGADGAPRARLDAAAPDAAAYLGRLEARQDALATAMARVAPGAAPQYRYRIAFNGIAARLTAAEAARVATLPGVVAVTAEERVVPLMDASLPRIGAPAAWADDRIGGRAEAGRGVRIAIIDSGISVSHPSFSDQGFVAPDGFPTSTLTIGDRVLAYAPDDVARFTNQKVIVARAYANPETMAGEADPLAALTPLADGPGGFHGAHVAGIAAGTIGTGAPGNPGTGPLDLSGVAPGAYVMAYKFNQAYTPEILRMIDDAVLDGADVINNSWGMAPMNVLAAPHHPVGEAFQGAIDAGVVVVSAAGNAGGNGEATLGGPHQMLDGAITVANSETGRGFAYHLYASHPDLPAELERHPVSYHAFGGPFTTIERQAAVTDLCNPVQLALQGRTRVFVTPFSGACATSPLGLDLPAELAWMERLLVAAVAQADAVVFYSPDQTIEELVFFLFLFELFLPIYEELVATLTGVDEVTMPVVALIAGPEAAALAAFAEANPALRIRLDALPTTIVDAARVDAAAPSSSQGPAAAGAPVPSGWAVKPDLSAPGTAILSANTAEDGSPIGLVAATGTSMSSPHVAGAAAVLRHAWPDWTPAQIKAALVTTAAPVISDTVRGAPAAATLQGAGRLDLARAIDPGLLLDPPSRVWTLEAAGVGSEAGVVLHLDDARLGGEGAARWTIAHEPGTGGGVPLPALPASIDVPAGGSATLDLSFDTSGLSAGDYDGRVALSDGTHTVRFTYHVRQLPERRDVLLLDVRTSVDLETGGVVEGPDHSAFWTDALEAAGLEHDVWTIAEGEHDAAPPLAVLQGYRLVVVAAGEGNAPLDLLAGGMTSLQMYLLGGGRMVMSGPNWSHDFGSAFDVQSSGAMMLLSRYFAGFDRTEDDAEAASLTSHWRPAAPQPLALGCPASEASAGNTNRLDLGRPLAALRTLPEGGEPQLDLGIAASLAAERLFGHARTLATDAQGRSAITAVTGNATLEAPAEDPGIPWRAAFAGFAVEGLCGPDPAAARADLLRAAWAWATERGGTTVSVEAPAEAAAGSAVTLRASAATPEGVTVARWRWDLGDGRPFVTTDEPVLTGVVFARSGRHVVRAEAETASALTYVGEAAVEVTGSRAFIPAAER